MASPLQALVLRAAEFKELLRILTQALEGRFLSKVRPITNRDPILFTNIFIDLNFVSVKRIEAILLTTRNPKLLACLPIPKIRFESGSP